MDDAHPGLSITLLTAHSTGAVNVFLVEGAEAIVVVDRVFRPRRGGPLTSTGVGRPRLGRIGHGLGDEVITLITSLEPPRAEIHSHGGTATIELILDAFRAQGAVEVDAVEPMLAPIRATDCLSYQAWTVLPRAPTSRAVEILLDQAQGALGIALSEVIQLIQGNRFDEAAREIEQLLRGGRMGTRLIGGWTIAFAGRPNSGKSQLFNALTGFERVIVADQPGTTRDRVHASIAIQGWPIALLDTAGLRDAAELIESQGVALARETHREADLVLVVLDRSMPLESLDHALIAEHTGAIVLANKCDLAPAWRAEEFHAREVSGLRGDGLSDLLDQIAQHLALEPPAVGSGVPFQPEQVWKLNKAGEELSLGRPRGAIHWLDALLTGSERPDTGQDLPAVSSDWAD